MGGSIIFANCPIARTCKRLVLEMRLIRRSKRTSARKKLEFKHESAASQHMQVFLRFAHACTGRVPLTGSMQMM
jgi:hypothetical protein